MTELTIDQALRKGVEAHKAGQVQKADRLYTAILKAQPKHPDANHNMGVLAGGVGKVQEALPFFKTALEANPATAQFWLSYIDTLIKLDKLADAKAVLAQAKSKGAKGDGFDKLEKSLEDARGEAEKASKTTLDKHFGTHACKPADQAEAYKKLGNLLLKQKKLQEAIIIYNKALAIKPDYVEAYSNIGLALTGQGRLQEAIEAYHKALAIKPDFAQAYNNMGTTLQQTGKLEEAIEAYNKALVIKPDYAEAFWNLSGTAKKICESKKWLKLCLEANPSHLKAKLTLSALQFYNGDKSSFNILVQSSLKDHPLMRSFAWAFELPDLPELYFHRWALFDRMIALSKKERPFYEFGVWRGEAFQHLISTFKKGYGFDTFEGIPEDWHDQKAGTYSSNENIPQIEGGEFIVGKFEDTLPGFFSEPRPKASIINFDADLYSSTICALNFSEPVIDKHTILIFDEFIINKNWEQDEYKALNEFCLNNNYTYEVLAVSFFTKQVAVRLIGL